MITETLRAIFNGSYPVADFQDVNVTIEFPMSQQNYPGIWVQLEDAGDLERAGINHREVVRDDEGIFHEVTRWRFNANLVLTVAALSSQERDRLFDEVVRVLAFSEVDESPAGRFKSLIEENDLIGIIINMDVLTPSGDSATPGTPWDTNEVIYEKTISAALIGEFVSDINSNKLYPLSRVVVQGYRQDEMPSDVQDSLYADESEPYKPGQWI